MEITYDGTLVMPSSFVVMDDEEVTYVDGGKKIGTYYGAGGWALAGTLVKLGVILSTASSYGWAALKSSIKGLVAGGPWSWLGGTLAALGLAFVSCFAGSFLSAGKDATWYMAKKGKFTFYFGGTPWNFLSVS